MKILSDFVRWFIYITIGILVVCAIGFGVSGADILPKETLRQILLSGFLTAVVTVLFHSGECSRKAVFLGKCILHFIVLCVVMILCGHWFSWIEMDASGIALMIVSVAVVYVLTLLFYHVMEQRQAEKINRRLREKYGDKE